MRTRIHALAIAALAATVLLAACDGTKSAPQPANADGAYDAKGTIVNVVPASGEDRARLTIDHEAIPNFVDREGNKTTMEGMTMAFDVAPDVNVGALHEGDAVEFHFEVRWTSLPTLLVTRVAPRGAPPGP